MTTTEILERCCREPDAHLALRSFSQFNAYELGYSRLGTLSQEVVSAGDLKAALREDYGIEEYPSNNSGRGLLTAIHGPEEGLRRYLAYHRRLAKPFKEDERFASRGAFDPAASLGPGMLMRLRPGMYFGNDPSSAHLWSFLSGVCWAEHDAGAPGATTAFMKGFQGWLDRRFSCSCAAPWGRMLLFLGLNSTDWSLKLFFEYFDFYQSGEPPDCLSSAARLIVENISKDYGPPSGSLTQTIDKWIAPL